MPQSRNRPKHHHHHNHQHHPVSTIHREAKLKRSAAFVVAILTAILGLAVAYFTQGPDIFWLVSGTAAGAIIGYFVGRNMDKSIERS